MLMMVSVVLSQLNMNGPVFIVNFLFMFEHLANLLGDTDRLRMIRLIDLLFLDLFHCECTTSSALRVINVSH